MKRKYDVIIGIDPDVDKSGIAILNTEIRSVTATNKSLPDLLIFLGTYIGRSVLVVVEASWKISHNWHTSFNPHLSPKGNIAIAAKKGYDVGRSHQVGISIVEYCRSLGLDVKEQLPYKKCWSGPDRKITHEEISSITKWPLKRSNQEMRDAALLSWGEAGFPIIISKIT